MAQAQQQTAAAQQQATAAQQEAAAAEQEAAAAKQEAAAALQQAAARLPSRQPPPGNRCRWALWLPPSPRGASPPRSAQRRTTTAAGTSTARCFRGTSWCM